MRELLHFRGGYATVIVECVDEVALTLKSTTMHAFRQEAGAAAIKLTAQEAANLGAELQRAALRVERGLRRDLNRALEAWRVAQ